MLGGALSHAGWVGAGGRLMLQERETAAAGEVWLLSLPVRAAVSRCRGDAPAVAAQYGAFVLPLEHPTVRCWRMRNFRAEGLPISGGGQKGGGAVRSLTERQVSWVREGDRGTGGVPVL